jgi:hypothetical protein
LRTARPDALSRAARYSSLVKLFRRAISCTSCYRDLRPDSAPIVSAGSTPGALPPARELRASPAGSAAYPRRSCEHHVAQNGQQASSVVCRDPARAQPSSVCAAIPPRTPRVSAGSRCRG